MHLRKIRRMGNSVGVTLPKDMLSALGAKSGDTVVLDRHGDGVMLRLAEPRFAAAMKAFDHGFGKYRNALRELAK